MPIPEEFDSERLAEIGLAILCLTASTDKVGTRAWKGMDWDVMGLLYERGWIGNPVGKAKSVIVTEEGLEKGESISGEVFWGRVIDWAPGHITMRRTGPLTSVMLLAVARSPPYAQLPVSFNVRRFSHASSYRNSHAIPYGLLRSYWRTFLRCRRHRDVRNMARLGNCREIRTIGPFHSC